MSHNFHIKTIYLDLDGVFVDFDSQFEKVIGCRPENSNRDSHYKNFSRFVEAGGFENAPLMPNAKEFFKKIHELCYETGVDLYFLTSDGSIKEFRQEVMQQKINWLQNHGIWLGDNKFILSHGWRGKSDYANINSVLIDDSERNVNHFVDNGGISMLYSHNSWKEIIKHLVYALT